MSKHISRDDARVIAHLRDMSETLSYCGPEARYDLQRNYLDLLRELTEGFTAAPAVYQDVLDEIIESIGDACEGGQGKVLIALRRARDGYSLQSPEGKAQANDNNVIAFTNLSENFERQAKADHYIIDYGLACTTGGGKDVSISPWGAFVLARLEAWQNDLQNDLSQHAQVKPILEPV